MAKAPGVSVAETTDVVVRGSVVHRRVTQGPGAPTEWNARWHRKRRHHRNRWERDVSWWIATLFCTGSVLFVVGGVIAFSEGDSAKWLNLVGSLGFSVGAVLSVVEAARAATTGEQPTQWRRMVRTVAGQAALIQVMSAVVLFQLAMILSAVAQLDWEMADAWIWTPSTLGSIGFVVASRLLWLEARPARDIGTWSTSFNLGGSALFLVGSMLGYATRGPLVVPANIGANPVFLAGSIAFTLGSVLSLVELETGLPDHAVESS